MYRKGIVLLAAGLMAFDAGAGGIYQRIAPHGGIELSNIPAGDGFILVLAEPLAMPATQTRPDVRPDVRPDSVPAAAAKLPPVADGMADPDRATVVEPATPDAAAPAAPTTRPDETAASAAGSAAEPLPVPPSQQPSESLEGRLARYRELMAGRLPQQGVPKSSVAAGR